MQLTANFKHWMHEHHMESRHDLKLRFGMLMHNRSFWAFIVTVAVLCAAVWVAYLLSVQSNTIPNYPTGYPLYPYTP